MRHIFVGDVHGCLNELRSLISNIMLESDDKLIFVGDLVDKGPNSLGTLRYVQNLLRLYPGSVAISGNHEEKALRLHEKGALQESWASEATPEDWAFIRSMPLMHRVAEHNILAIHGGIFPAFFQKHPDAFPALESANDWRSRGGKLMDRARRFLRVRFVNPEGNMVQLGQEQLGDRFWADTYDGRLGFIVYGHQPFPRPRDTPHSMGIDTGCVSGGMLTAFIVPKSGIKNAWTDFVFPARRYSEPFQEA